MGSLGRRTPRLLIHFRLRRQEIVTWIRVSINATSASILPPAAPHVLIHFRLTGEEIVTWIRALKVDRNVGLLGTQTPPHYDPLSVNRRRDRNVDSRVMSRPGHAAPDGQQGVDSCRSVTP